MDNLDKLVRFLAQIKKWNYAFLLFRAYDDLKEGFLSSLTF